MPELTNRQKDILKRYFVAYEQESMGHTEHISEAATPQEHEELKAMLGISTRDSYTLDEEDARDWPWR